MQSKNAACPCGSGKKFKHCCFLKPNASLRGGSVGAFEIAWSVDGKCALLIFLMALLLRMGVLFQMRDSLLAQVPILDGAYYYSWGLRIAAGDWKGGSGVYAMSPGYPYVLAVLSGLLGKSVTAVYVVQCIISSFSCVLTYIIARRFFSVGSSGLAAFLLCAYGGSVFYANLINKASWIEFLNAASLLTILSALDKPTLPRWMATGLLLGASAHFRPNILLFLPAISACAWYHLAPLARSQAMTAVTGILLGAGLMLAPVALRNRIVGGEWVLTTAHGGMNFYTGNNAESAAPYRRLPFARTDPKYEQDDFLAEAERRAGKDLTRAESSRFWYREAIGLITGDVSGWLVLLAKKFSLIWTNYEQPINQNLYFYRENFPLLRYLSLVGYSIIAPLGIWGVILSFNHLRLLPLHLYLLTQVASLVTFFVVSEYRHPATFVLLVYVAGAFDWFRERISSGMESWKSTSVAAVAVILGGWLLSGPSRESLAYRQDLSVAYNNLGCIYIEKRRWVDAVAALKESLAILPDFADAHYNLSESYINQNRPEEAKFHVLEGMRINPGFVASHFRSILAQAYVGLGEWDKAVHELKAAVESDPADPGHLLNLALIYRRTGRNVEAVAMVDRLLSQHPSNGPGLLMATEMAIADRNGPKLFQLLPRLAASLPDSPQARNLIGTALASTGHYREAKTEFEKALKISPDFGPARANLDRLNRLVGQSRRQ